MEAWITVTEPVTVKVIVGNDDSLRHLSHIAPRPLMGNQQLTANPNHYFMTPNKTTLWGHPVKCRGLKGQSKSSVSYHFGPCAAITPMTLHKMLSARVQFHA